MKRPISLRPVVLFVALAGCDYSAPDDSLPPPSAPAVGQSVQVPSGIGSEPANRSLSTDEQAKRDAILENVVKLIRTASLKPGGDNFAIATENLNQYFSQDVLPVDYRMSAGARNFLLAAFDEKTVKGLENSTFDVRRDARHIEDCMLYRDIALRVAGDGDELVRVQRVFDWLVKNIVLVPVNSLAGGGLPHVPARPYDVLVRGMAVEQQGVWCERTWVFMALCRQLGIDVGLLTYAPRGVSAPTQESETWACAALIGGTPYLFDARLGIAIPGPDGTGVATLEEALTDPVVLDRLDLPGEIAYRPLRSDLLSSPKKIGVLIDSSIGYLLPRMKLLEGRLAGKNRSILYRDPAQLANNFSQALGSRGGGLSLWSLPLTIENALFTPGSQFGEATLNSMRLFDQGLPLLYARIAQLRGELDEAKLKYVDFRLAENGKFADKKTPIPPPIQAALDQYATYFLALCQLDLGNTKEAEFLFSESVRQLPEPGPGRPAYLMLRWGSQANLARLLEAKGELGKATALYYTSNQATFGFHGNLLRARDLVWLSPMMPVPDPVIAPAPPGPTPVAPPPKTTVLDR